MKLTTSLTPFIIAGALVAVIGQPVAGLIIVGIGVISELMPEMAYDHEGE